MLLCTRVDLQPMRANSWNLIFRLFAASLACILLAATCLCTSPVPYKPCPLSDKLSANLSEFEPHEICDTINLVGSTLSGNYSHCRIVKGFVSIRHLKLQKSPDNYVNVHFPKLEVITDFLLLYNIKAIQKDAISLNAIFPKLRLVAGRQRFMNHSLYISHFYAGDTIELGQLAEVCGPMWLQNSPSVCFRHSNLYWRMLPRVEWTEEFGRIITDLKPENLLVQSIQNDHFDARLKIPYIMPEELRPIWHNFSNARFSIFDIDPAMYRFILGETSNPPNCTKPDKKVHAFEFADLVNSDHVNTFLVDHMRRHLDTADPLGKLNLSEHCITGPPQKMAHLPSKYNFVNAHYDIRHIYHSLIPRAEFDLAEMDELYAFKYDHVYIIKVLICFGPSLHNCAIAHFNKLLPIKGMFQQKKTSLRIEQNILGTDRTNDFAPTTSKTFQADKAENNLFSYINFTTSAILLGGILGVLILVALVVRLKHGLQKLYRIRLKRFKAGVVSVNPEYTPIGSVWSWDPFSQSDLFDDISYEIVRSSVKLLYHKLIGQGEFGAVYEGLLFVHEPAAANQGVSSSMVNLSGSLRNGAGHTAIRVAIKQLRDNAKQIDKERFITEAKFMRTFNSNFLVKLIGVCTLQEPLMVVMEYMEHGDLKRYLRQKYKTYQEQHNFAVMPTFETTIRMAIQIADGMYYLHSKRVIHRDLAARNCMVAADFTVKIGDFGMTRCIYQSDYYRLSEQALMPLRWMAPESVRKMIFTSQTDVWSYGVVLWEIMCFGEQPYKGKTDQEVKEMLMDCGRLPRPTYYTPIIWELAKRCWTRNSQNRPNFRTIIETLYPYLNKHQNQFDKMSHYHSSHDQHRPAFGFSLSHLMSENCFAFFSKFCHQYQSHGAEQNLPACSHQQQHQQPYPYQPVSMQSSSGYSGSSVASFNTGHTVQSSCFSGLGCRTTTTPLAAEFHRQGSCRSSVRSTSHPHSLTTQRPRCASFDSLQTSMSAFSEATTLTMISSNPPFEPSIQSRHNSAGSNNSATSTTSEQIPLI